jgi:hypothetical protein
MNKTEGRTSRDTVPLIFPRFRIDGSIRFAAVTNQLCTYFTHNENCLNNFLLLEEVDKKKLSKQCQIHCETVNSAIFLLFEEVDKKKHSNQCQISCETKCVNSAYDCIVMLIKF